ncbi:MAG: EamA family transporter, partial [Actinomycetota bacterium]
VNGAVSADLLASFPPGNTAQVRSILAALILGALAYRRRAASHHGRLPGLALLGLVLATVTVSFFTAISRLGVGPGVTIQFTGPVLVLGWLRLIEKRHVPRLAWVAASVALIGVGLVSRVWEDGTLDPIGLAAAATASVTFAAYLLGSGHLGRHLPALTIGAYGFGFSALILLFAFPLIIPPIRGVVLAELGWLVVLGTVVPFLLEVVAIKLVGAGTVGVVATLEPVIAATTAWLWLGQSLYGWQVIGGLLVVGAVAVVQSVTGQEPTPIA